MADRSPPFPLTSSERARKAEKFKAERKATEDAKRLEIATQLRDEAKIPAYQAQIEDCQTIIDYLSGNPSAAAAAGSSLQQKKAIDGIETRQVRAVAADDSLVAFKKKNVDEEVFFGGGGKKKGSQQKKKVAAEGTATPPAEKAEAKFQLPLHIMRAIMELSIPLPTSNTDVPRAVEDLKTKKAWFEANNDRQTKLNVDKAESESLPALPPCLWPTLTDIDTAFPDLSQRRSGGSRPRSAATSTPQTRSPRSRRSATLRSLRRPRPPQPLHPSTTRSRPTSTTLPRSLRRSRPKSSSSTTSSRRSPRSRRRPRRTKERLSKKEGFDPSSPRSGIVDLYGLSCDPWHFPARLSLRGCVLVYREDHEDTSTKRANGRNIWGSAAVERA